MVSVDAQSNDHDGGSAKTHTRGSTTPNASSEQKAGAEGKYIGLTGTEDVYFVVDRFQGLGNDPAREAYFRVGYYLARVDSTTALLINVYANIGTIIFHAIGLVQYV